MKIIKLTAVSAAVLMSTAAMAQDPIVVVDNNNAVVYQAATPAYQYQNDAGIIRNTTGAVVGTTKTIFNTLTHPASVSAEVGTLGYGANLGFSINEKVELQAGWAGGDVADLFGGDLDVNDVNYDIDSDFSNPYMGVQLRPAGNWFTMGAGIIVPDNSIDVTSNPENGSFYKIDGVEYNASDVGSLEGSIDHRNKLAPYLTLGFRPNITNNFGVFGEIGAAYLGKTDAEVRAVNGVNTPIRDQNGTLTTETSASVAQRAERELEDKNYIEFLPIVKLGATYRF